MIDIEAVKDAVKRGELKAYCEATYDLETDLNAIGIYLVNTQTGETVEIGREVQDETD